MSTGCRGDPASALPDAKAIVYHWKNSFPGRERVALDIKKETEEALTRAVADGIVTDFAWYLSANGDLQYLVVRGEMDNLVALTSAPEVMMRHMRCAMANDGFTWSLCGTGATVEPLAQMYEAALATMP